MAEGKKRKIISAAEAKGGKAPAKSKSVKKASSNKKSSKGLRIWAVVLWLLAIGFEVIAILLLKLTGVDLSIFSLSISADTFIIAAIVIDAVLCILGSLMWKRANRISPCTSKSKFVCFIWNQMGVIACLIAFIPFGVLLLRNTKMDAKMKKIIVTIAALLLVGSVGASIDYNPPTPESVAAAEADALAHDPDFDGTVYWTLYGKSYHLDVDCHTLANSEVLISGTLEEALDADRSDPCDFCALNEEEAESENE